MAGAKARFLKNKEAADPGGLTFCDPGDRLEFHSAGGGGYGDPLERDPKEVERDALHEYVSIQRAKMDYGVIIDPKTMKADLDATAAFRKTHKQK